MIDILSNNVTLRVHGGTPRTDKNLCNRCRYSSRRTSIHGKENLMCDYNYYHPLRMTEPIAECNRFLDASHPTLDQMAEIAWQVMTDKGGRKIGFQSPEERRNGSNPSTRPIGF